LKSKQSEAPVHTARSNHKSSVADVLDHQTMTTTFDSIRR